MDTNFWVVQSLGILTTIITIFSYFQMQKWKIMVLMSAVNLIVSLTYLLCGDFLGCFLVFGTFLRCVVFFFYSKHGLRPPLIWLLLFETYFIVFSVFMWSGPINILMIVNVLEVSYVTWQDDLKVMRFGFMLSSMLLIPYDILLGAYTTAFNECVALTAVVIALIKCSKPKKDENEITLTKTDNNKKIC